MLLLLLLMSYNLSTGNSDGSIDIKPASERLELIGFEYHNCTYEAVTESCRHVYKVKKNQIGEGYFLCIKGGAKHLTQFFGGGGGRCCSKLL